MTKSKVATELFKSPAATPVKASSIRKHKPVRDDANLLTPVKSVQKARRAIDFMEFLDEKVGNTPGAKQVHFSGKSFSAARQGKPVELKTKKQTKSAKRKSLKRSSSSRTPRKARRGSRNLARAMTPAKEPRQEKNALVPGWSLALRAVSLALVRFTACCRGCFPSVPAVLPSVFTARARVDAPERIKEIDEALRSLDTEEFRARVERLG